MKRWGVFPKHFVQILTMLLAAVCCVPLPAEAQKVAWDDFLQAYSSDEELAEEEDWLLSLEELKALHEEPMNINTASVEELMRLPFLSPEQIEEIHAYIYLHGEMKTLGELRLLRRMDETTRRWMPLFVFAAPVPKESKKPFTHLQSTFSSRLDIPLYYRKGYQVANGYRGDALYHRIRYDIRNSSHLQAGLRIEKDAGERYYDSYGAYAFVHDLGAVRRAVVGDYRLGFGEGLVMGGSMWNSKSTPAMRTLSGLRPMTSMDEARFLRGGAITLGLGREVELSAFVSYRKVDATLNSEGEAQTLLTTGYHRTASEIRSRRSVENTLAGGRLAWKHGGWHLGTTGYATHFSRPLNPGSAVYRRFYPQGRTFGIVGADYGYSRDRLTIAGETAYSSGKNGWGTLNRLAWAVNHRYTLSLIQRYYDRSFYSFHSSAFAENGRAQNENGVLLHMRAEPWQRWQVVSYIDFFHNPWPRYRMSHSSTGQEFMLQMAYPPDGNNTISLRYQLKRKEQADVMEPHHRLRAQWTFTPRKVWRFQTTALLHQVLQKTGAGLQETVQWWALPEQLRLTLSSCYFHTDDYLSRLYFYVPALYNSVVSGSFFGHGLQSALSARFVSRNGRWMVEGRYALVRYFDREEQGSGLQTIASPWKNDLSLQFRLRF